jgi:NADH dehydrogenase
VFVIGDMAAQVCARTGKPVPGVAPAAMQMADMVARIIGAESAAKTGAKPPRPAFSYFDKGSMATIGRARAVAEVAGLKMRGLLAWLAWLFVHVLLLVGFRNRVFVMLSWGFAYLAFSKGARIITGHTRSRLRAPLGAEMEKLLAQRKQGG